MTLDKLRDDFIKAFWAFARTPHHQISIRQELWDEYVLRREAFLRKDAHVKGYKYQPLAWTLITDYSPYKDLEQ